MLVCCDGDDVVYVFVVCFDGYDFVLIGMCVEGVYDIGMLLYCIVVVFGYLFVGLVVDVMVDGGCVVVW